MTAMKKCTKCGRSFPATPEYFHRDPHLKSGLYPSCKECSAAKARPGTPKRRFIEGKGVRFLKNGKMRCHAMSWRKVKKKAESENRRLTEEDVWPDCQCGKAAVPGRYVCRVHGGASRYNMNKSITSYVKGNLADKVLFALQDPEILDQRKNMALLEARNAQLLEELTAGGLTQYEHLQALYKGLSKIEGGSVRDGVDLIRGTLDSLKETKAAWDELRQNMRTIKDLQQAEVKRQKEMRLTLTAEQVMAKFERLVDAVLEGVEKNVKDPEIIEGVYQHVSGALRESIGTPGLGLLAAIEGQSREDN